MKKIIETISMFRNVYVVDINDNSEVELIASNADSNYEEYLGHKIIEVSDYDENIFRFKNKKYFYSSTCFIDEEGYLSYQRENGEVRRDTEMKVK